MPHLRHDPNTHNKDSRQHADYLQHLLPTYHKSYPSFFLYFPITFHLHEKHYQKTEQKAILKHEEQQGAPHKHT